MLRNLSCEMASVEGEKGVRMTQKLCTEAGLQYYREAEAKWLREAWLMKRGRVLHVSFL